jgi:hypothetical protein
VKVYEFVAETDDGHVSSYGTHIQSRDGTGALTPEDNVATLNVGAFEFFGYQFHQIFLRFITSSIEDDEVVLGASLMLTVQAHPGPPVGTIRVRSYAWATPLTGTAFRGYTLLADLPLLAVHDLALAPSVVGQPFGFASTDLMAAAINKTGETTFIIHNSRQETGEAVGLGQNEQIVFHSASAAAAEVKPRLFVYTSLPSRMGSVSAGRYALGRFRSG